MSHSGLSSQSVDAWAELSQRWKAKHLLSLNLSVVAAFTLKLPGGAGPRTWSEP